MFSIILAWALSFISTDKFSSFSTVSADIKPVITNGGIAFVFDKDITYSFDFTKAVTEAKFKLPFVPYGSPTLNDGVLYSYTNKGYLIAYSIKDAKILWKYQVDTLSKQKPLVFQNTLLVTYTNPSTLVAVDIKTGKQVWSYTKNIPTQIYIEKPNSIVSRNNLIYITIEKYLIAINSISGTSIFEKFFPSDIENDIIFDIKTTLDGFFITTYNGTLYKVSYTGQILWHKQYSHFVSTTQGQNLLLANSKFIKLINTNAIEEFSYKLKTSIFPYDIKVINKLVFVASNKGILVINIDTKREIFHYNNEVGISSLFVLTNKIIAQSFKNIFYIFNIYKH